MEQVVIDSVEELYIWARENRNTRLMGLIEQLRYGNLEERILALTGIINALKKRHKIRYTDHFLNQCLLFVAEVC